MSQLRETIDRIEAGFAQAKSKAVDLRDQRDALAAQVTTLTADITAYRENLTPDVTAPEDLARLQNLANELEALNAAL